jgi:hypothetical protein
MRPQPRLRVQRGVGRGLREKRNSKTSRRSEIGIAGSGANVEPQIAAFDPIRSLIILHEVLKYLHLPKTQNSCRSPANRSIITAMGDLAG